MHKLVRVEEFVVADGAAQPGVVRHRGAEHPGQALDEVGQAGLFVALGLRAQGVDRQRRDAGAAEGKGGVNERGAAPVRPVRSRSLSNTVLVASPWAWKALRVRISPPRSGLGRDGG